MRARTMGCALLNPRPQNESIKLAFMSNRNDRESPDLPAHPWTIYVLIAVAAFASGSALTMMLRRNAPSQPRTMLITPAPASATSPTLGPLPLNADPVTLGNAFYDQQNWAAAIQQYERVISRGTDTPDVRTDLGNAYRFAGNPHKALEQYQIAQRQNPNHEQSLFNQGALYAQSLSDPITGAAKWREFVNRFPASIRAAEARRLLAEFEREFGTPPIKSATPAP
jgi:tetratricopeptide (TPR) repeat protein